MHAAYEPRRLEWMAYHASRGEDTEAIALAAGPDEVARLEEARSKVLAGGSGGHGLAVGLMRRRSLLKSRPCATGEMDEAHSLRAVLRDSWQRCVGRCMPQGQGHVPLLESS